MFITGASPSFNIPENKYVTKVTKSENRTTNLTQVGDEKSPSDIISDVKTSSEDDIDNIATLSTDGSAALTDLGHDLDEINSVEAGLHKDVPEEPMKARHDKETTPGESGHIVTVFRESKSEDDKVEQKDSTERELADAKKSAGKNTLDFDEVSQVIHDKEADISKKKPGFIKVKEKSAQKQAHQINIQELESELRMAEMKETEFKEQAKEDSQVFGKE